MSAEFVDRSGKSMLTAAVEFGASRHLGQKRNTGEPYFDEHCLAVASIIRDEWGITDEVYQSAAILHDTVEDTHTTIEEISQTFGKKVADLVEGVTKFSSEADPVSANRQTLRKVIGKSYLNPGIAIIKLADRLHNLRTISGLPPERQQDKAKETLEVYTRLAESLGMWEVKTEMEDIAFAITNPETFTAVKAEIDADPRLDQNFLSYIQTGYQQMLADNDIEGAVDIRRSGYYALAKKRETHALAGKSAPDNFSSINDLVSVRIRVPVIEDCYQMICTIHNNTAIGKMVDYGRDDEFIGANKRDNGYQAFQTTVNYPQGPVEIAVASNEMEEFNRTGIISFIKRGQIDLIKDKLPKIVFAIKGTRFLPNDATGIDLAFHLNSQLGADATDMIVDGKKLHLSAVVSNASSVEFIVGPSRRAQNRDLLQYCKMPSARAEFKRQLNLQEKDEFVAEGLKIMLDVLKDRGFLVLTDVTKDINGMLLRLGCSQADDLYFKVGGKFITPERISEELDHEGITKENLHISTVRIQGTDEPNILLNISELISKTGKNIEMMYMQKNNEIVELRFLIKDLSPAEENSLRESLLCDSRFSCLVV